SAVARGESLPQVKNSDAAASLVFLAEGLKPRETGKGRQPQRCPQPACGANETRAKLRQNRAAAVLKRSLTRSSGSSSVGSSFGRGRVVSSFSPSSRPP